MSAHPDALTLEALAVGERHAEAQGHLESCAPCRAYVERARAVAGEGASLDVAPVLAFAARRERRRSRTLTALAVVAPLAAAAAVLVWLRASPAPTDTALRQPGVVSGANSAGMRAEQLAVADRPDLTFKGGLQLAVVRQRGMVQERFSGPVRIRPGDRLRVEVALDRRQVILAALVADDGSYLEMMADEARDPGTHLSEKAAKVDASAMSGTIVVGAPDAVQRYRASLAGPPSADGGVQRVRLEWEAP